MVKQMIIKNSKKIMLGLAAIALVMAVICSALISVKEEKAQEQLPTMKVTVLDISDYSENEKGDQTGESGENAAQTGEESKEGEQSKTAKTQVAGKERAKTLAKYDANGNFYINQTNTVVLQLEGTDDVKYKTDNLTQANIRNQVIIKVGDTDVTSSITTMTLGSATKTETTVTYELTLSGIPGNGQLSATVKANTLEDESGNKNDQKVLTTFDKTIYIDNTNPTVTFGTNGSTTYAKSKTTSVDVTDTLDSASGVASSSLKYLWKNSATAPAENEFTGTFTSGQNISSPANVTGTDYYLWILAKDNVGNTTITRSNAFYLDNTAPSLSLSKDTDNWAKSVGVIVDASDAQSRINTSKTKYAAGERDIAYFENDGTEVINNRFNVTTNGKYTVYVEDNAGNATVETIEIGNADSIGPEITSSGTTYGQTLSITLKDTLSGVTAWQVTSTETEPSTGWTTISPKVVNENTTVTKSGLNAGTYYIWAKDEVGNVSHISVTVAKAQAPTPTVTPHDAPYDGNPHTVTVTNVIGGTAQYSTDRTNYSTTAPTYTDFTNGEKPVYVKIVGDSNHTDSEVVTSSINITKAAGSIVLSSRTGNEEYGTTSSEFTVESSTGTVSVSTNHGTATVSYNSTTNKVTISNIGGLPVGEEVVVTVSAAASTNYSATSTTYTLTISKTKAPTPTVTPYEDEYDENPHTVTVTGVVGGTVEYSTDSENWSETAPTYTNVGEYPVYVRVKGDENHGNSNVVASSVKITAKAITEFTINITEAKYTGSAITVTPTVKSGTKTLTENTDYEITYNNTNINIGTATATATGKGNYLGTFTQNFSIYYEVLYQKENNKVSSIGATSAKTTTGEVTLPSITPATGYRNANWYNGNTQVGEPNATITVTGNVTLTAKVDPITYEVRYNGNEATSGSMSNSTHTYDVAKNLTKNAYSRSYVVTFNHNYTGSTNTTRTGTYSFDGWSTTANGTKAHDNEASVTNLSTTQGAIVDIYARWIGGSVSYTPSREGYTFQGWYDNAGGTGTRVDSNGTYTPTSTKTLFAKWQANNYTVTYNYPPSVGPTRTVPCGENIDLSLIATKDDYTFVGWNTDSNATTALEAPQKMPAHDVTLYAIFRKDITVTTYQYNNQPTIQNAQLFNNDATVSVTLPTASNITIGGNTYTPRGWSTSTAPDATIEKANGATIDVNSNVTYYMSYERTVTGTFNYWNGTASATATATATQYVNYEGTIKNSDFDIPSAVANSNGKNETGHPQGVSTTGAGDVATPTTANTTFYAIYSKTITATLKTYNDQTTTKTGTFKAYYDGTTANAEINLGSADPVTVDGVTYTPKYWSTSASANATSSVALDGTASLSQDTTYYMSYEATITSTFYYRRNNSSTDTQMTSTTAQGTRYMNYQGSYIQSNLTIPNEVTNSTGLYGMTYSGISTDKNSLTSAGTPTTANTAYYAYYTKDVTCYYYNGTSNTSGSGSDQCVVSGENYVASANSRPSPSAYSGNAFAGWSNSDSAFVEELTIGTAYYATYPAGTTITFYYFDGNAQASAQTSAGRVYISKNGGMNSVDSTISVPDVVKQNRTKEGAAFTYRGLSTSQDGNATIIPESNITIDNTTYYASYERTVTATKYIYNDSSSTATGTAYMNSDGTTTNASIGLGTALNITINTKDYTPRGWSTSSDANAEITVALGGNANIFKDTTYYMSYQRTVTGTFYYWNGSAQSSETADKTQFADYKGVISNSTFEEADIPAAVKNSTGPHNTVYQGVSTSLKGSIATPTTANDKFYAIYSKTVTATLKKYNNEDAGTKTGTGYGYSDGSVLNAEINLGTVEVANGYNFRGWSTEEGATATVATNNTVNIIDDTTYYASYSKTVTITLKKYNNQSAGTKTGTAYMNYKGSITNASINLGTVEAANGYNFRGWSTSTSATGSIATNNTVSRNTNATYYASYQKTVTATKYVYNNSSSAATGTAYMNYQGSITNASIGLGGSVNENKVTVGNVEYTPRGWSTNSAADANITVELGGTASINTDTDYFMSYQATITARFYYRRNNNATDTAMTYATDYNTRYMGYTGLYSQRDLTIPSAVISSTGLYGMDYSGISTSKNSTTSAGTPTTANTEYYAYYTKDVTCYYYNGSNHTSGSGSDKCVVSGENYVASAVTRPSPTPAYNGHAFAGWSNSPTEFTEELTTGNAYYAGYPEGTTITFYYFNGSTQTSTQTPAGRVYISRSGGINSVDSAISVPDVVKENRTKDGVTFTYRGLSTSTEGNATIISEENITIDNTTYYATYTYTPTISFNSNSNRATGTMQDITLNTVYYNASGNTYTTSYTLPANAFQWTAHNFTGWNTQSNGSGTSYNNQGSYQITAPSTVLYAQWSAIEYTLTANANGGTISASTGWTLQNAGATATKQIIAFEDGAVYGRNGALPTEENGKISRTGYRFLGWHGAKNLFNKDATPVSTPAWIGADGEYHTTGTEFSVYEIDVEPNTTYTITNSGGAASPGYVIYNSSGTRLTGAAYSSNAHVTFTTPANAATMRFTVGTSETSSRYDKEIFQIEEGPVATAYAPYYITDSTPVTIAADHTITAEWEANEVSYTVNHYVHDLNAATYTLNSTSSLTEYADTTVTISDYVQTIRGYTYEAAYVGTGNTTKPNSGEVTTTTIAADGSTVINIYYRRNYLYIKYNVNGGNLAASHGASYSVEDSFIKQNSSTSFLRGVYGSKVGSVNTSTYAVDNSGLHNYNSASGINIEYTGRKAPSGEEWNTSASGTGTSYGQDDSTIDANGFGGADLESGDQTVTLYVNWKLNTLTITYEPNGGTDTIGSVPIPTTIAYEYNEADFATNGLPNYDGNGDATWNLENYGKVAGNIWHVGSADSSTTVNVNTTYATVQALATAIGYPIETQSQAVTLYSDWTNGTFTVTAEANNGTIPTTTNWTGSGASATKSVTYSNTYGNLPTPTRAGYNFDGWQGKNLFNKDDTTNKEQGYINAEGVIKSTNTEYSTYTIDVMPNTQYTITTRGKSGSPGYVFYDEDKNIIQGFSYDGQETITFTTPANAIKMKFAVVTDTTSYRYEADIFQIERGGEATSYEAYQIITSSTTVTRGENHILTAKWKPKTYTITFNPMGGTVSETSRVVTYGEEYKYKVVDNAIVEASLPEPTRTGYKFDGWQGMNLFDQDAIEDPLTTGTRLDQAGAWIDGSGNVHSPSSEYSIYQMEVKQNTNYRLVNGGGSTQPGYAIFDENGNYLDGRSYNSQKVGEDTDISFTTPAGAYTIKFSVVTLSTSSRYDKDKFLIKQGSGAASYENYKIVTGDTIVKTAQNHVLTAKWSKESFIVSYNANKFTGRNISIDGVTITYDDSDSTITLDGKWESKSIEHSVINNQTLAIGDTYNITLTYVSGSYTSTVNPNFILDVANNGMNLTNRAQDKTTTSVKYPTSGTATNSLTLASPAEQGNGLKFWMYQSTANATTFNNYKVKINVTKKTEQNITYGDNYSGFPATPTRLGHTFDGWYTAETGGTPVDTLTQMNRTEAHTIYAHWNINTLSVTYDPNGGTDTTNTTPIPTTIVYPYNGTDFATHGLPNPDGQNDATWSLTKTGYSLTDAGAWHIGSSNAENTVGSLKTYETNQEFAKAISKPIEEQSQSVTLYAKWNANKYTVTFNVPSGATVSPKSKRVTFDEVYGDLPTPERPGYQFNGWYKENTYTNVVTPATIVTTAANHTLYSKWTPLNYTVTYNANIFAGLDKTTNNGLTITYDDSDSTLTLDGTWTGSGTELTKMVNETLTQEDTYDITLTYVSGDYSTDDTPNFRFETQIGGNNISGASDGTTYKQVTLPTSGTATGSLTLGSSTAGANGYRFGIFQSSSSTTTFEDYKVKVNITKIVTATISFESNYTIPSSNPKRVGHTFNGWYTQETGGTQVTNSTLMETAGNHTLYAQWTPNTITINYKLNGGTGTEIQDTRNYGTTSWNAKNYTPEGSLFDVTPPTGKKGTGFYLIGSDNSSNKNGQDNIISATTLAQLANKMDDFLQGDITVDIYPEWEGKTYTVTYSVPKGATVTRANDTVKYGETYGANTSDGNLATASWNGCTFNDEWIGVNLYNKDAEVIYPNNGFIQYGYIEEYGWIGDDGNISSSPSSEYSVYHMPIKSSTNFVIQNNGKSSSPGYAIFDKNGNYLTGAAYNGQTAVTFTTPSEAYFIRFSVATRNTNNRIDKDTFLIKQGSNVVDYEAYKTVDENTLVETPYNHVLTAKWIPNEYEVTYNANMFAGLDKTSGGVTITYDDSDSTLTLKGTWTSSGAEYTKMINQTLTQGDTYDITLTYVSGSYTTNTTPGFRFETQIGGANISGASDGTTYRQVTFPTSGTATGSLTLGSSTSGANGYRFGMFQDSSKTTTFTDYKVKVNVTKRITANVKYTGYYSLPTDPTRVGHTFETEGWYTKETGGTKVTSSTQMKTIGAHTVYAHWTPNTITINYNANGGTGTISSETINYGTTSWHTKNNTFTPLTGQQSTGYWKVGSASSSNTVGQSEEVSATRLAQLANTMSSLYQGNITVNLYAGWEATTDKVLFDATGGTVSPSSKNVTYGSAYGTLPTPTRDHYTFDGWNGRNLFNKDAAPVHEKTWINASGQWESNWKENSVYNVYQIEVEPSTVYTLTNSGGVSSPAYVFYDSNGTYIQGYAYNKRANITFTTPSNAKYMKFTVVTGSSANYDKDIFQIEKGSTNTNYCPYIVTESTIVNITGAHTLKALWTEDPYTITYNANMFAGVDETVNDLTIKYDDSDSTLTIDGTWSSTSTALSLYSLPAGEAFNLGDTYDITLTNVSGSYTSSVNPNFIFDIANNGVKLSNTVSNKSTKSVKYPSSGTTTASLTLDTPADEGNGIIFRMYQSTAGATTFDNYKVKVNVTKRVTASISCGDNYTLPSSAPTRIGHTFDGWYTEETGGTQITSSIKMTTQADHTVYAHWTPNTITINYNANGGTGTIASETINYGTTLWNPKSNTFTPPTGMNYTGSWNVGSAASTTTVGSESTLSGTEIAQLANKISNLYQGNITITLYATKAYNKYTVTFNPGVGTITQTTKEVTYNSAYGALPTAKANGYTFGNWYKESTYTNVVTSSTIVTTASDHTLYAKMDPKDYIITANANGGTITAGNDWTVASGGATATKTITYNTNYGTLPTATRTGWVFDGWWTSSSGGTEVTSSTVMAHGAHTIYAHWHKNTYTVTYNANKFGAASKTESGLTITYDGSDSTLTLDGTWESRAITLSALGGQSFNLEDVYDITLTQVSGNYTSSVNPNFIFDIANNGVKLADTVEGQTTKSVKYPQSGTTTASITLGGQAETGNGILFRMYQATANATTFDNYTVKINVTKHAEANITYGNKYSGFPEDPTRAGYKFTGWYDAEASAEGFRVTGASTMNTASNHTIYAHWRENVMTINYATNGNGGSVNSGATEETLLFEDINFTLNSKTNKYTTNAGYAFTSNQTLIGRGTASVGLTESLSATDIATKVGMLNDFYDGDISLTWAATWDAQNVRYTVNHYVHNLNVATYTLSSTLTMFGKTDSTVTLEEKSVSIPGFTYVEGFVNSGSTAKPSSGAVASTTIDGNGNTVINLYYRRNYLYVRYNMNGGSLSSVHGSGYGNEYQYVSYSSNTKSSTEFLRGVYGGKVGSVNESNYITSGGLHDYNSQSGINLVRTGYTITSGAEWICNGTTYSQSDGNIDANGFAGANLATGDKTVEVLANWVDTTAPRITVNPTSSTGASKKKSIKISISEEGSGLSSPDYSIYLTKNASTLTGGETIDYTNGETFTIGEGKTGTYYIYVHAVYDGAGNMSTASGSLTTIDYNGEKYHEYGPYIFDNTDPTYSGWNYAYLTTNKSNPTKSDSGVTVNVNVADVGSGISKYALSYSSTQNTSAYRDVTVSDGKMNVTNVTLGIQYYLWIKDGAGNVKSYSFKITSPVAQKVENNGSYTYYYYQTLQKAIGTGTSNSSISTGTTNGNLVLLSSISETITNKRTDRTITINMNGKTISGTTGEFAINNQGKLTLTGTSDNKGKFTTNATKGIYNTSELTLSYMQFSGNKQAVKNTNQFSISNSTVKSNNENAILIQGGSNYITNTKINGANTNENTVMCTNGTTWISGDNTEISTGAGYGGDAVEASGNSTVYFSGGTLKDQSSTNGGAVVYVTDSARFDMSGGKIENSSQCEFCVSVAQSTGRFRLSGGNIVSKPKTNVIRIDAESSESDYAFDMTGGTIISEKGELSSSEFYPMIIVANNYSDNNKWVCIRLKGGTLGTLGSSLVTGYGYDRMKVVIGDYDSNSETGPTIACFINKPVFSGDGNCMPEILYWGGTIHCWEYKESDWATNTKLIPRYNYHINSHFFPGGVTVYGANIMYMCTITLKAN